MKVVGSPWGFLCRIPCFRHTARWLQSLHLHPDVRGPKDCHEWTMVDPKIGIYVYPKIQTNWSKWPTGVVATQDFFHVHPIFGEDEPILDVQPPTSFTLQVVFSSNWWNLGLGCCCFLEDFGRKTWWFPPTGLLGGVHLFSMEFPGSLNGW